MTWGVDRRARRRSRCVVASRSRTPRTRRWSRLTGGPTTSRGAWLGPTRRARRRMGLQQRRRVFGQDARLRSRSVPRGCPLVAPVAFGSRRSSGSSAAWHKEDLPARLAIGNCAAGEEASNRSPDPRTPSPAKSPDRARRRGFRFVRSPTQSSSRSAAGEAGCATYRFRRSAAWAPFWPSVARWPWRWSRSSCSATDTRRRRQPRDTHSQHRLTVTPNGCGPGSRRYDGRRDQRTACRRTCRPSSRITRPARAWSPGQAGG